MNTYAITLPDGTEYEIDAPDENTAWRWAKATREQELGGKAAAPVAQQQPIPEPGIARVQGDIAQSVQSSGLVQELSNPENWKLPGSPQQAVEQLGQNVGVAARGAVDAVGGTVGLVADPIVNIINSATKGDWPTLSQSLTNLMNQLGVPDAQGEAQKVLKSFSGAATAGGGFIKTGEVLGRGIAPTVAKGIGEAMASQPAQQLAGAGGASVATQLAEDAGADPLMQMGAGLLGGVAAAKAAGTRIGAQSTEIPKALQAAEDRGIKVMTSDIFQPKGVVGKSVQTLTERNPFLGTGPVRAQQQEQRVEAVRDILKDYGASDVAEASTQVMKDVLAKRSAELGKWTKAKTEVLDKLAGAGTVPVDKTVAAIDEQIANLKSLKTESANPVISTLEDWKTSIQGQDLANLERLRGDVIGKAFTSSDLSDASRDLGKKALNSIYAPIREDMRTFIQSTGGKEDLTKWMVANKQLADMAGELKKDTLSAVLRRGDATPEVVERMLFSSKPSDVQALYRNLTPEGRGNARAAILAKAAGQINKEDAARLASGETQVSPEAFSKAVGKLGNSVGVFFTGDDLDQIRGLTKVLNMTKRAAEATANPQTGIQTLIPTSGILATSAFGGGIPGFVGAMAAGTGMGAVTRLYESKPVRDLLIHLSRVKSPKEEAALFKRLSTVLAAKPETAGKAATQLSELGGQRAPQEEGVE